ncbi:MAG: hypothetical protein HY962_08165 [Ignavibacteriae bacterium]|nr:hypothetical protein [Ignavibacteriota bacterium]
MSAAAAAPRLQAAALCLVMLCALSAQRSAAQCCTAGNPVNTNSALPQGGRGRLGITASYMLSSSDTYYRGTTRLDKTYTESGYNYSSLGLTYGLSSALRLTADLGYYFDKSQRFVASDYTRYTHGLSDATLGVMIDSWSDEEAGLSLAQTARITVPVGTFDQEYDGVVLPIDFQPSSGNYRYNLGLMLTKQFPGSGIALISLCSIELSQAIETKNTYHKYGNLYNASLLGIARITTGVQGLLQLRLEARDRALNGVIDNLPAPLSKNNQYSYISSSGGVLGYVSPQIVVSFLDAWTASLQFNYPFYKNVYGEEQLTTKHSLVFSLSHSLDLGPDVDEEADISDPMLPRATLSVAGACDMCKERIEETAARFPRVMTAQWNEETRVLTVFYKNSAPDLDGLERALAAVGHDTEHYRAEDEVYLGLPKCCRYRGE